MNGGLNCNNQLLFYIYIYIYIYIIFYAGLGTRHSCHLDKI
ncbi:MAG: hypothetical protein N7Q72_03450 [Spiroplasma sp. Tabriz.8]|nr:hypothetical protein [Spiroplasma sp. Tabriz.8]